MNLKNYLTTPLQRPLSRAALIFLFVVAGLGFIDATYLTIEHYANRIPPCTTEGCEIVLTSAYSEIAGMPVALLGVVYYFIILLSLMVYLDRKNEKILRAALFFTPVGLLASIYFLSIQAFVIKAFCQYCLFSAATSTILFIAALIILKKYRTNEL